MVIFHSYVSLPEGSPYFPALELFIFWGCYHSKIFQAMLVGKLRAFACESGTELLPFFLVIMDPFVSPHYERTSNGLRMIPLFFEKPEP